MNTDIFLLILAGLGLFIYAIAALSESTQLVAGENLEQWLRVCTKNLFWGILTGILVTAIIGSSSAVIIITIILINSRVFNFRQAIGVVLGANIGTTMSSQVIAFDLGKISPVFIAIGLIMHIALANKWWKDIGKVILYFGILFFGLQTMERAVEPLRNSPWFVQTLSNLDNLLAGTMAGMFTTLIIQSSSATVGIAIVLVKKSLLSLKAGISVMMGAELGTVSDTLLATINGTRQALKTGVFHFLFNLISIVVGLLLFTPFYHFVEWVSRDATAERALANAHMWFNILGVVLFVWFVPLFERLLNTILPDKTTN
ncbi:MAG: Na/Pi symporter [Microscillaceae bacterium]|nr:Na/Pi symporter [Microscillaceae bacterium]MDW8459952.1 Na/Pi symporter [Cytophagales bacterium]